MKHCPQLDALRCIAVFGVMLLHYLPSSMFTTAVGGLAVQLFFALSAFLVTTILLKGGGATGARPAAERSTAVRTFYARRALRLLPVYFLMLLIAGPVLIHYGKATLAEMLWHGTFLTNVLIILRGEWIGPLSPLWTLAVQEQFYLLWPCLLLFTRGRIATILLIAAAIVALLLRAAILLNDPASLAPRVLVFCCLDALALGALMALHRARYDAFPGRALGVAALAALGIQLMIMVAQRADATGAALAAGAVIPLCGAVIACWIVARAADGFGGAVGWVLTLAPLLYLGRISYGLYIYHNLFPWYLAPKLGFLRGAGWGWSPMAFHLTLAAVCTVLTIIVAAASWHLFEEPISRLKRKFPQKG